ncbi:hypothetical protein [Phaeocystidibacter luteus]|uniref:Porin family protein n=1 Tax=Phaeocystidibacter luteus TaxID=911197 RepID=A0A6N6RGV4_9FLAO|nr:hypothetical protein [Phaeocystidibacter luteus]KAB2813596.1 hypothetical protein F8C67_05395 [Phaeocystidibacter luteus]
MKLRHLFIGTFMLLALVSMGQTKGTNDLSLNVGFASSQEIVEDFANLAITAVSAGSVTYENVNAAPTYGLEYAISVYDNWFFLADGYFQTIDKDVFINGSQDGSVSSIFLTVGFGTDYHYVNTNWLQVYSGISVAYTRQTDNYTGTDTEFEDELDELDNGFFNFHVNAIGARFGKKLGITAEVGYGYRGIANIGLSYQF